MLKLGMLILVLGLLSCSGSSAEEISVVSNPLDLIEEIVDRPPICTDSRPMTVALIAEIERLEEKHANATTFIEAEILVTKMDALISLGYSVMEWHKENCVSH